MARKQVGKAATSATDLMTRADVLAFVSTSQIIVPVVGGTYALDGSPIALLVPLAAIGSCTLNLPASPFDTQKIRVSTQYTITTLTVSAGSGKSINGAPTTITTTTPFGLIYRAATTTWFRI